MNIKPSVERLPDGIRERIAAELTVADRLRRGMDLGNILSSRERAAEWAVGADAGLKLLLGRLLLCFAGIPFEEEKAEAEEPRDLRLTGAEIRVGLVRLRLAGILFAVRKTWGERLYYLPTDMVPVWQRLILPLNCSVLTDQESRAVKPAPAPFRLPLSLELLSVWAAIRRHGLPLTIKGAVAKPAAARLAAAMRLTGEELAALGSVCSDNGLLPPPVALALDLGLCAGVLRKSAQAIAVSSAGLASWLALCARQPDAELNRLAVVRYASSEPARHLAAAVVASCAAGVWYRNEDVVRLGIAGQALGIWLDLLVSWGWAERGMCADTAVFRLLVRLDCIADAPDLPETAELFFVQPDGEIFVPPDVGLEPRWKLEELADCVTSDRMFVYRLTKDSCRRAYEAGWNESGAADFLERESGLPLPEPVRNALRDWFGRLGRTRLAEVVLLRTDSEPVAAMLRQDPAVSSMLGESLGSRDFIVERSALKSLAAHLEQLGCPPDSSQNFADPPATESDSADTANAGESSDFGSLYSGDRRSYYEPDRAIPAAQDLFPGVMEVPPAWLRQPGTYHVSTRRELIRRAIGWRTALQVERADAPAVFIPQSLDDRGDDWQVTGRWRHPCDQAPEANIDAEEMAALGPDALGALMILLPQWEPHP